MIDRIRRFFADNIRPTETSAEDSEHRLRLACAALLIEVARADIEVKDEEMAAISAALRKTFGLSQAETDSLIALAAEEADMAVSFHSFTALINASYDKAQKIQLIERLWEVVYADAELEKYEEHLVRKLAELLYVPHSQFIASKLRVQQRLRVG